MTRSIRLATLLCPFVVGATPTALGALNGGARHVSSHTILTGTARFMAEDAGAPSSPLLASVARIDSTGTAPLLTDSAYRQSVRQHTLGATATLRGSDRWTHSAVVGVDGYRLNDAPSFGTPFTSAADSALRAARGSAVRGTARVSTVAQLGATNRASGSLTFALEHSAVREASRLPMIFGPEAPASDVVGATERTVTWRSNTGLISQLNTSFRDAVFVSGGVRFEYNGGYANADRWAALPMVGAAYVRDIGGAALKFRTAYGSGIRPPETTSRATSWMGSRGSSSENELSPEEQSGLEAGIDFVVGRALGVHVTRFDQIVSGLIQPVAVSGYSSGPGPGGGGGGGGDGGSSGGPGGSPNDGRRIAYVLQNVGEITNRGWELAASAGARGLLVSTAFSTVESRVRRLAYGYTGDLSPGDRMLEVPDHTVSVTTSYSRGPFSTSVTGSRAYDWVNYDRLSWARRCAASGGSIRG